MLIKRCLLMINVPLTIPTPSLLSRRGGRLAGCESPRPLRLPACAGDLRPGVGPGGLGSRTAAAAGHLPPTRGALSGDTGRGQVCGGDIMKVTVCQERAVRVGMMFDGYNIGEDFDSILSDFSLGLYLLTHKTTLKRK